MTKEDFEKFCEQNNKYLVCYHEAIGRFEMINNALADLTGFSQEELVGRNPYDFIHPADKDYFQNRGHFPALEGKDFDEAVEYRFQKKDGDYTWFRTEITTLKNDRNHVTHLLTATQDINEVVSLRSEKEQIERLFNDTCRIARIGAWAINLENMITTWSRMVYDIHETGYDYQPDLDTIFDFFPGDAKQMFADAVSNAIDKALPFDMILPFITAKGNTSWVRVIGKARIRYGKTISLYGVFQNMNKHMEEKNLLSEKIEEIEKEMFALGNVVMNMQLIS